jgi:bifunctional N-acetylglucosamine-1-phosphate-uridyltransferase/glucosamine-1-phosphate-acetyltransferase GlmU-like protein
LTRRSARTSTSAPARSRNCRRRDESQTVIEDGAFIGSDTQLVAPVTIKQGAYVGSGTTIREDVPAGALAVSAGKQRNIEHWVEQKKKSRAKG